jgi:hypothetical protein
VKVLIAGTCASGIHFALMWAKSRSGILPEFQPYEDLQCTMAWMIGGSIPLSVSWITGFFSGAVILGFVFSRTYKLLPGTAMLAKGAVFGVLAWAVMGAAFFPLIGEGVFAWNVGRGFLPALLSLAMLLAYGIALSAVDTGLARQAPLPAL